MEEKFTNKTALIIGGSSGIGKETARQLLIEGASVIITGRNEEKLKKAKEHLERCSCSHNKNITIKQFDLTSNKDRAEMIDFIKDLQIDILVNSAGYFYPKSFLEHKESDYDIYMEITKGFFFITQEVAKKMKESGKGGSIVNVGSMWAHQAIKVTPSSAYSMAKAALHSLTQHLAMELAPYKIRVNAIAPAVVETSIYEAFIEKDKVKETLEGFNDFHPLGRIGTSKDAANGIIFLLSDKSSWTTGVINNIDGGVMAGRN